MDKATVRQSLQEVTAELAVVEERRAALIAMLRGYEEWLRVYDPPTARRRKAAQQPAPADGE